MTLLLLAALVAVQVSWGLVLLLLFFWHYVRLCAADRHSGRT